MSVVASLGLGWALTNFSNFPTFAQAPDRGGQGVALGVGVGGRSGGAVVSVVASLGLGGPKGRGVCTLLACLGKC